MSDLIQPQGWPRPSGYANGIAARGRTVAVAGQVGWDPASRRFATREIAGQARQALLNVVAVLRAAGAGPEHLVRVTWYVRDREEYALGRPAIGEAWRDVIGDHYPAMSLLVVGLLEPEARVEIEATAVVPE